MIDLDKELPLLAEQGSHSEHQQVHPVVEEMYEHLNVKLEPLRQKWIKHFELMFGPPPARLPPLQEVNHTILLIDPDARYSMRTPRCSSALFLQLQDKTECYVKAGWWKPAHGRNASPLLTIPNICTELKLCTVIDTQECNVNTIINSMPLPNQDMIRKVVASHPFVSIIDISDAYEQMRIIPEDVPKTLFSSLLGTYISNVLQQGDCNGPSLWQRLMMHIFREQIGTEVWVYLDNIYIFSKTLEEHKNALEYVYKCLYDTELYISPKKFKPYAIRFNCLGHYTYQYIITPYGWYKQMQIVCCEGSCVMTAHIGFFSSFFCILCNQFLSEKWQ
jgi:hypothetical protein